MGIYILWFHIIHMGTGKRGRPRYRRIVKGIPETDYFKPRGIPLKDLETIRIKVEELEAISLVDSKGLKQEKAANEMEISRRTLARDLRAGRKKIADALLQGKAIELKGGDFIMTVRRFKCYDCGNEFEVPHGTGGMGRQMKCPKCGGSNVHRADPGQGAGRGRGPSAEGRGRGGAGRGPRWKQ